MAAIDTNVLVRFVTGDDPVQLKASQMLFASENIFIPHTVVLETAWVLRAAFNVDRPTICDVFRKIFGLKNVTVEHPQRVAQAIDWHEAGLDFADALHLALSQDHDSLKTFDKAFIKGAKGVTACRVALP